MLPFKWAEEKQAGEFCSSESKRNDFKQKSVAAAKHTSTRTSGRAEREMREMLRKKGGGGWGGRSET